MSEWSDKQDRITRDMEIMTDPKYNTKYFIHRVILFLRAYPERAEDWLDFVPDWQTRNIDG